MVQMKLLAANLYHNSSTQLSIGCGPCPDKDVCGGLSTSEILFDCTSLCHECNGNGGLHLESKFICRHNFEDYINRHMEVGGWYLDNIPRSKPKNYPKLPLVIPLSYGSSKRFFRLNTPVIAIPFEKIFDHATGLLKYKTRESLADYFGFNSTSKIVITGVGKDGPIERYWSLRTHSQLPQQLARLRPDLVTVPNYSLFVDVPRWDNLYAIKRIAICWNELVRSGIATSLHVNARTDVDWERWTEFISARDEVRSIAYEFATGPACIERGKWHTEKLIELACKVNRPLQLVIRGGYYYLRELANVFDLTFIDTTSFLKTAKRKRLEWFPEQKKHWRAAPTVSDELLDSLLLDNVVQFSNMLTHYVRN
jgi:hypothetical protein